MVAINSVYVCSQVIGLSYNNNYFASVYECHVHNHFAAVNNSPMYRAILIFELLQCILTFEEL